MSWSQTDRKCLTEPGRIEKPLVRAVLDCRHDLAPGGRIGAQLVRDYPPRGTALLLQQTLQQAFGRLGVAPALDDLVKHIAEPESCSVENHQSCT
jgi:hypothetical protein